MFALTRAEVELIKGVYDSKYRTWFQNLVLIVKKLTFLLWRNNMATT